MTLHRIALALIVAASLTACAGTPTPYAPTSSDGYGFREQQVETDRYIVTFAGNGSTSADLVADMALRRAADLTLTHGFEWFEIVGRTDGANGGSNRGSGVHIGVGGVSGSRGSSVGTSVGLSLPLGGGSGGASSTALEIKMGSGERPARPSVYDALEVSRNLGMAVPAG